MIFPPMPPQRPADGKPPSDEWMMLYALYYASTILVVIYHLVTLQPQA